MINTWVWRLTLWWSWYRVSFWNYCLMVFNRLDINWNYSSQTVAHLVWAIECIFEIIISQGIVVQGVKCFLSKINEKINIFTDFFLGNPLPKYNYLHRDLRYCLPSLKNAWDLVYLEQSPEIWLVVLVDWEREKTNYYYKLWKIETPVGILLFCHSKCFADQFVILKKKFLESVNFCKYYYYQHWKRFIV